MPLTNPKRKARGGPRSRFGLVGGVNAGAAAWAARTNRRSATTPVGSTARHHLAALAGLAAASFAFLAQSSQQTTITLPPTLTWMPPSLISQSHTGHFVEFMTSPRNRESRHPSPRRSRLILVKAW